MLVAMTHQDDMTHPEDLPAMAPRPVSRLGLALLAGGGLSLLGAGLLLWRREGDRLFTDGMIAAIVACF